MSGTPSLIRTGFRLIGLLMVCLAVWALLIGPLYDEAIAATAGQLLRHLESPRMIAEIEVDGTHTVISHTREFEAVVPPQRLELGTHHNNAPLLIALILGTPGLSWARRMRVLVIGLGALAFTHVLHFMLTVQMHYAFFNVGPYEVTDLRYMDRSFLESLDSRAQTAKVLVTYGQAFYTHVGRRLMPVLLWIVLCWRDWAAQVRVLRAPADG